MKNRTSLLLIGLALLFTWSCNLDYFEEAEIGDIVFDPSVALPVGEITYTVDELFQELNDAGAEVGTTDENVVSLIYEQQLQSQSATSFLAVLDQSFGSTLAGGNTVTNPPAEIRFTAAEVFEFDISQRGNEAYDSIAFSGGQFAVSISSEYNATVNFELTFISLESNQTPLRLSGMLTSSNPNFDFSTSLEDYIGYFHLDANGDPSTDKFLVSMEYEVIVPPSGSVDSSDAIDFNIAITNTTFNTVYGDVGTQDLTVSFDVANLDFFK